MYIQQLQLRDFRSWAHLELDLAPGITVFVGRNGYGKTNIVEAVGYLAHLSSHRVNSDAPLVRAEASNARISASIINHDRELVAHLLLQPTGSNQAQINRTRLKSPRELLGVAKTVLFSPEDLALVRGEPSERRRYLDAIIASRTPRLAGVKADYDKVLKQRNALLKSAASSLRRGYDDDQGSYALSTLDVWDNQLAHLGAQLISSRLVLIDSLKEHLHAAYAGIAPESRPATVAYNSTVDSSDSDPELIEAMMLQSLGQAREREIERGISLVGPHRDDLQLMLGSTPAKGYASHGETWSYAIALRLAEFELLRQQGSDPILILDDVFSELDAKRRQQLVQLATDVEQVLITAAVEDDIPSSLQPHQRFVIAVTDDGETRRSFVEA